MSGPSMTPIEKVVRASVSAVIVLVLGVGIGGVILFAVFQEREDAAARERCATMRGQWVYARGVDEHGFNDSGQPITWFSRDGWECAYK